MKIKRFNDKGRKLLWQPEVHWEWKGRVRQTCKKINIAIGGIDRNQSIEDVERPPIGPDRFELRFTCRKLKRWFHKNEITSCGLRVEVERRNPQERKRWTGRGRRRANESRDFAKERQGPAKNDEQITKWISSAGTEKTEVQLIERKEEDANTDDGGDDERPKTTSETVCLRSRSEDSAGSWSSSVNSLKIRVFVFGRPFK